MPKNNNIPHLNEADFSFSYDELEHYYLEAEASKLPEIQHSKAQSELDSLKIGLMLGRIPSSIEDLSFIARLPQMGYTKTSLKPSQFEAIHAILNPPMPYHFEEMACLYVYKDILIFKNKAKVVGLLNICFACQGYMAAYSDKHKTGFRLGRHLTELAQILQENKGSN